MELLSKIFNYCSRKMFISILLNNRYLYDMLNYFDRILFPKDGIRLYLKKNEFKSLLADRARNLYSNQKDFIPTKNEISNFKNETSSEKIKLNGGYKLLQKYFGESLIGFSCLEFGFYNSPLLLNYKKLEMNYTGVEIIKKYVINARNIFPDSKIYHGDIVTMNGLNSIANNKYDIVIAQGVACMTAEPDKVINNALGKTDKYFLLGHNLLADDELFESGENYLNMISLGSNDYIFSVFNRKYFEHWAEENKLEVIDEFIDPKRKHIYKFGPCEIRHTLYKKSMK